MTRRIIRAVGLLGALLLSGCAVPAGGPYYGGYYDAGAGYYEPLGGFYGAWGPGYFVGPYHDDAHGFRGRFFHAGGIRGRGVPSIAGGFRGGTRGGGFHGGGVRGRGGHH